VSQQINLYSKALGKSHREFSALTLLQAWGVLVLLTLLFYAYGRYQLSVVQSQLALNYQHLTQEQSKLATLAAEISRKSGGLTVEQELKKIMAEAQSQREIIAALKSGVIGNTNGYSAYMEAFARQSLTGLWLTGFMIEGDAAQMSISGAATRSELVPVYIGRLNNEKMMRGKTFASLQMQLSAPDASKAPAMLHLQFTLQSVDIKETDK
jgi:Tfp pilus assembly protein PilN